MILEKLPTQIDFRPNTEFVDDQKAYGSCVAHAAQTALEIAFSRAGQNIDLSRMFLYYYIQKYAGTLGTIDGGYPKDLGPILENHGVCQEKTWVYDATTLGQAPSAAAYSDAKLLFPTNSTKFSRIFTVEQIRRKLAQGKPVVIGMAVHWTFQLGLGKDWRKHEWNISGGIIGYHAVTIIGYDDMVQRFLCENSWSSVWGDGGFFGLPYEYCTNGVVTEFYCWDQLPVKIIAEPGYIEESTSTYDDASNIIELPSIDFYPGNFAKSTKHVGIRLKVLTPGDLKLNDEVTGKLDRPCFFYKNGDRTKWQLLVPKIKFNGDLYSGVVQTGANYEILSIGE